MSRWSSIVVVIACGCGQSATPDTTVFTTRATAPLTTARSTIAAASSSASGPASTTPSASESNAPAAGEVAPSAQSKWLEARQHLFAIALWLHEGPNATQLDSFGPPVAEVGHAISDDGRYGYLWYKHDRRPQHLAVYDLATRKRLTDFTPGFGGDMHWTPGDTIIHWWGCGTNCEVVHVYDVHGIVQIDAPTSAFYLSPMRTAFVTAPSLYASKESIVVFDLITTRKWFELDATKLPERKFIVAGDVRWNESSRGVQQVRVPISFEHSALLDIIIDVKPSRVVTWRSEPRKG